MIDLLNKHIDLILTGLGSGLITWIVERRRKKAEVKQVESDANVAMQKVYNTFVEDMKEKYDELKKDYAEMKVEFEIVKLELADYKEKYHSLKAEMQIIENGVQTTPNNGNQ